jgi:hypothetical protein
MPKFITLKHWLLLLLATAVYGCSSPRILQDFKSGTDFSQLKTYSWRSATIEIPGIGAPYLQQLADEQLQAQGFVPTKEKADFLVDMQGFSRVSSGGNTSIGIGLGLPIGRHGSIGLGTGQMLGKGKQEGVVVIDITQADTNTLIWRGNAEGIPLINFSLKAEQKLRETFAQLLTQFPPQSRAE